MLVHSGPAARVEAPVLTEPAGMKGSRVRSTILIPACREYFGEVTKPGLEVLLVNVTVMVPCEFTIFLKE